MLGRGSNPNKMGTLQAEVANKENSNLQNTVKESTVCKNPKSSCNDGDGGHGDNARREVQPPNQFLHPPREEDDDDDDEEDWEEKANLKDEDEEDDDDANRDADADDEAEPQEDLEEDTVATSSNTNTAETNTSPLEPPISSASLVPDTEATDIPAEGMSEEAPGVASTPLPPESCPRTGPAPSTVHVENAVAVQVGIGNVLSLAQTEESENAASCGEACRPHIGATTIAVYINNCGAVQVGNHNRMVVEQVAPKVTPQENEFVKTCIKLGINPKQKEDIFERLGHEETRQRFAAMMAEKCNVRCKLKNAGEGCILLELEVPTEADRLQLLRMARDGTFQQVLLETFLPELAAEGRAVNMNLAIGIRNPSQDMLHELQGAAGSNSHENIKLIEIPNGVSPDTAAAALPEQQRRDSPGSDSPGTNYCPSPPDCPPPVYLPQRNSPGRDSPGRDSPGRNSPGRNSPGRDSPGRDSPGRNSPGRNSPGRDSPGRDSPGRDSPGRNSPGRNSPGRDSPGRNSPGRNSPGRDSPGRNSPGRNSPGRNSPGRNSPGRNSPGRDSPGRDSPGRNSPGRDSPGRNYCPSPVCPPQRISPGRNSPGRDSPGRDSPGRNSPGRNSPGRDSPGRNSPGRNSPGRDSPGRNSPGRNSPGRDSPGRDSPGRNYCPSPVCPPQRISPGRNSPGRDSPGRDSPGRDSPGRNSPGRDSPGRNSPGRDSPGRNYCPSPVCPPQRISPGRNSPGRDSPGRDSPGRNSPGFSTNTHSSNTDDIYKLTSLLRLLSEPGDAEDETRQEETTVSTEGLLGDMPMQESNANIQASEDNNDQRLETDSQPLETDDQRLEIDDQPLETDLQRPEPEEQPNDRISGYVSVTLTSDEAARPGLSAHPEVPPDVTSSQVFERSRSQETGDKETTKLLRRLAVALDRREWKQVAQALRVQQPEKDLSAADTGLRMRILRDWQAGPSYGEQFDRLLLALQECGRDDFAVELLQSAPQTIYTTSSGPPIRGVAETPSVVPTQLKETSRQPKQPRKPPVDPRTPLRRMPYQLMKKIAMELDPPGPLANWKDLADCAGYSMQEIGVFDMEYLKPDGSPTRALLQAWGTRNATVQDLLNALRQTELLNVAEMLAPDDSDDEDV
ncbi:uncharacterized protein LOC144907103 [Branchiostoma floridae x Branchiostoma belcheri]